MHRFHLPSAVTCGTIPRGKVGAAIDGTTLSPLATRPDMSKEAEFEQQLRDALHHLYDYPYLQRHPLAVQCFPDAEEGGLRRAHRFNRLLLESIEELNPPGASPADTSRARFYTLLVYRYVDERPLPEIMRDMGCSRSQFFREQQKAITLLASTLREKLERDVLSPARSSDLLDSEASRVLGQREAVDPAETVRGVLAVMRPVAEQRGVTVDCDLDQPLPSMYGSRTLLRQVLLRALSDLFSREDVRRVGVLVRGERDRLTMQFHCTTSGPGPALDGTATAEPELGLVRRLVEMMGGHWQDAAQRGQERVYAFDLPVSAPPVLLVIDDNEGIFAAFQGFVAGHGYKVVGARNATDALRLARELHPAAITLDIMMPSQDGWEILQALKADPDTRAIPVIICSVLDDPHLARALGAAAYLQKPIGQRDLLDALRALTGPLGTG